MSSAPSAHTLLPLIRKKLENKVWQDWYLDNPHLWADKFVGEDVYEKHILKGGEWKGWQDNQIAFLRDICDPAVRKPYAVCCRGGSKTWTTAIGTSCLHGNISGLKGSIISGSYEQASVCYDYISDTFTDSSLKALLLKEPTRKAIKFKDRGIIRLLTASTKRTKAPRSDYVIIDEACEAASNIIKTILPQTITATQMKIIILTTPDDMNHIVHDWWNDWEKKGFTRHQWNAYQCAWIPRANIEELRNIYDHSTFRIMVMGEWASKTGNPFKRHDILACLCDITDLPPVDKMDRFCVGVDWGDAHPTVATVLGLRGDVHLGTDEWYVYEVVEYQQDTIEVMINGGINSKGDQVIGIADLAEMYGASIWSEQAPISIYPNKKLRIECIKRGITMRTGSFSRKKNLMVNNLVGTIEKHKAHIPRVYRKLYEQLLAYHYKEISGRVTEEFEKVNDDYVDSFVWARWMEKPYISGITTIGDVSDL